MTRGNTGTGEDGHCGDKESAECDQSVNDRSLFILQVISQLNAVYPQTADVSDIVVKLHADDDKSWDWLCDLGLIQGEPVEAHLTEPGKRVVEIANLSETFQGVLESCRALSEATDGHASAVLVLLYANYDQRYTNLT